MARLGSYIGLAIGLAGVAFVTRLVIRDWDEITEAVGQARPAPLVASVVIGLCGMTVIGLNWLYLVHRAGAPVRVVRGLAWYFVGQLGKYVPGGIWPVVGRAELAGRAGVGRRAAYTTTATSMFSTYFTAGAIAAALAPAALGVSEPLAIAAPVVVVAVVAAVFHPRVISRVLDAGALIARRRLLPSTPSWRAMLLTLAGHLPAWGAITLATWAVARALSFDVDILLLATATPMSWLAGFVVIGLPGGLGVRESVFVAVVATETSSTEALSVALLARMVFVGVDILGALVATLAASATDRGSDLRPPSEPGIDVPSETAAAGRAGSPAADQ
jgi:glycosyltransferase 2 family protein